MSDRKEGWYWVRTGIGWECARWEQSRWYIVSAAFPYEDKDWQAIGPRIPTPDEPWQCVPKEANREMVKAAMDRGAAFGAGAHYAAMLAFAPKPEGT